MLPLVMMDAEEVGLPLDEIHRFLKVNYRHRVWKRKSPRTIAMFDPPIGRTLGKRLEARISSLLGRSGYRFANGFARQHGHGDRLPMHLDRAPLDVTMSLPIVCEGADGWPLRVDKPDGGHVSWAGRPGTVLVVDGRRLAHGRDAFEGTRYVVLLLHWTAPALP